MIAKRLFDTHFGLKPPCNGFGSSNLSIPFLIKASGIFCCLLSCLVIVAGCQRAPDVPLSPHSVPSSSISSPPPRLLGRPYRVAILPFENMTRHPQLDWLRRGLQEMLVSDLAQWSQLEVVSRDVLGSVLREQWLQQRGFSSDENTVGLGRLKGVRYLIQGRMYAQEEALAVDLQIVDVETGVVVGAVNAKGLESDIPGLEQDIVTRVLGMFDPSLNVETGSMSDQMAESSQLSSNRHLEIDRERGSLPFLGSVPSHAVNQIDALLSLEMLTHKRREAYWLAETIWHEGWVSEIGNPLHQVWQFPNASLSNLPIMAIPISLFFSPHRLAHIFEQTQKTETGYGGYVDSDGFRTTIDEASGAQLLFVEHFQKRRRVFIRAINEQGDVVAIFSDWGWRTERKFTMQGTQGVSVPMWPNPFITGFVKFPVDWVEREGRHVTFDSVVVPVPDEQVLVLLEPIGELQKEEIEISSQNDQEDNFLKELGNQIKSNWTPSITEGLPVRGYLPGNKRTAVGIVHAQDGKIRDIQFQHWPEDPFFLKSLQDLQLKLLGACLECRNSGQVLPPLPASFKTFRLQLTLVKDIHALHLGSRSH
ncbi:CsgG/HfaB family protein [Nitrospira sp. Ecomares 2.1]